MLEDLCANREDVYMNRDSTSASELVLLPRDAGEPGEYCVRAAKLQRAVGEDIQITCQPVLWITQLSHLRPGEGPSPLLPHCPLWWAGDKWQELPDNSTPHAQTASAYEPRRFHPPFLASGLFKLIPAPDEGGPEDGGIATYAASMDGKPPLHQSGVMRSLRALLCQRLAEDGTHTELWARPVDFGEWKKCPHQLSCELARTEGFEVCGGDMYVFLFRSRAVGSCGLDIVMLYNVILNAWLPLVSPTRSVAGGHAGDAPVKWRPVDNLNVISASRQLHLNAWLLESNPDHLVLLSAVSRDGIQRGDSNDVHSAVHFVGRNGEVVSHHMSCHSLHLTLQRYEQHILFVKDFDEHPHDSADACLDDNWNPSYPRIAGWLWNVADVAVPPLEVHLPSKSEGWGGATSSWGLVIARGNVDSLAPSRALQFDAAPRLYLLESGPILRLWASRRIDDSYDTVLQRYTFDGREYVRHSLSFQEVQQSYLEVGNGAFGMWSLWSADLLHAMRIGLKSWRLSFWRCAITSAEEKQALTSSRHQAYRMAVESRPVHCPVEEMPLHRGWLEYGATPEYTTHSCVVSGLPNFPTLRWHDGSFNEDDWMHPISKDAAQHAPSVIFW